MLIDEATTLDDAEFERLEALVAEQGIADVRDLSRRPHFDDDCVASLDL